MLMRFGGQVQEVLRAWRHVIVSGACFAKRAWCEFADAVRASERLLASRPDAAATVTRVRDAARATGMDPTQRAARHAMRMAGTTLNSIGYRTVVFWIAYRMGRLHYSHRTMLTVTRLLDTGDGIGRVIGPLTRNSRKV